MDSGARTADYGLSSEAGEPVGGGAKVAEGDWNFGPGTVWHPTSALSYHELFGDPYWAVNGVRVASSDRWWGEMLDYARTVYGDDSIGIAEGDLPHTGRYIPTGRYLAYGDGAHLPFDGRVAFSGKDATGNTVRYVQNGDGTVNRLAFDGTTTGTAIKPDRYTYSPDKERVIGWANGQQVFSAPVDDFKLPDGAKQFRQLPNGDLVPVPHSRPGENGVPNIPGAEVLEILPEFPGWFRQRRPGLAEAFTRLFIDLRLSLGSGDPALPNKTPVPYNVSTTAAGIDEYGDLKQKYTQLTASYNSIIAKVVAAVQSSAALTKRAREEVATAIYRFNQRVLAIPDPQADVGPEYGQVLGAVGDALSQVVNAINVVVNTPHEPGRFDDVAAIPGAAVVKPGDHPDPRQLTGWAWDHNNTAAAVASAPADVANQLIEGAYKGWGNGKFRVPPIATEPVALGAGYGRVAKAIPVVGTALGVTIGSITDIQGGMDPGKAITTNAGGAVVGGAIGGVIGSAIPIPVVGTVVGVAVGTVVGTYATKLFQKLW
jgi:hypothetical protein